MTAAPRPNTTLTLIRRNVLRPREESYVIAIPALDDWEALGRLLPMLEEAFAGASLAGRVLIIDDGSRSPPPPDLLSGTFIALTEIMVLHLRRNLGHQRAIAIGFAYIADHLPCTAVIVMDADGEDRPADVPRLVEALYDTLDQRAVFAKRARRSEGLVFRAGYGAFCGLHLLLTGLRVEVGNFSVVPYDIVRRLGSVSETWNHYAAAVVCARIQRTLVPMDRGVRLVGKSRMNFSALATHGLQAMSVLADRIGFRLLVGAVVTALGAVGAIALLVVLSYSTKLALPAWSTTTASLIAVLLVQSVMMCLVFAVALQVGRSSESFLPTRDYHYFIDSRTTLSS